MSTTPSPQQPESPQAESSQGQLPRAGSVQVESRPAPTEPTMVPAPADDTMTGTPTIGGPARPFASRIIAVALGAALVGGGGIAAATAFGSTGTAGQQGRRGFGQGGIGQGGFPGQNVAPGAQGATTSQNGASGGQAGAPSAPLSSVGGNG